MRQSVSARDLMYRMAWLSEKYVAIELGRLLIPPPCATKQMPCSCPVSWQSLEGPVASHLTPGRITPSGLPSTGNAHAEFTAYCASLIYYRGS